MGSVVTGKILIVDDSELNRAILTEILCDEYSIIEAENGLQALKIMKEHEKEISLILLDIVMPDLDGFAVLDVMKKDQIIEHIPVIMISSENETRIIRQAYELGVSDYINRPFDAEIVRKRVGNTIKLYSKQKLLIDMVADQIYEKQKSTNLMVNILSHIVEFRNGESGLHVLHVHILTKVLLKYIARKTDRYDLTDERIELISTASALHDIGKIAISDEILNKPGKFTPEEFEIMKTHSMLGAEMLEKVPFDKDEPLIKVSYEICRWHHERYDGRGYPDGLKGEEIPISAQAVSLADVYDALTAERVYKKPFSHEKAIEMILNGECGAFNPLLLDCLREDSELIRESINIDAFDYQDKEEIIRLTGEMLDNNDDLSKDPITMLLQEDRQKNLLLDTVLSNANLRGIAKVELWLLVRRLELAFDDVRLVDISTSTQYKIDENGDIVTRPYHCWSVWKREGKCDNCICQRAYTQKTKVTKFECMEDELYHIISLFVEVDKTPYVMEMISHITDASFLGVHSRKELLKAVENYNQRPYIDPVTGVYNRIFVQDSLKDISEQDAAIAISIDHLNQLNESCGTVLVDSVMQSLARTLSFCVRKTDYVIRYSENEFLLIFINIPRDIFLQKLERIKEAVENDIKMKNLGVELPVHAEGVTGANAIMNLIHKEDSVNDIDKT